ncbi:MAG: hypothetical protein HY238_19300 [Acidobacteria bacterium]|nr:hypothetical protein [Acidobacteriota bacterium]
MLNRWTKIAAACIFGAGLLGPAALAQGQDKDDKWTIRQRQRNQQKRIGEGVEKGQLTPKETEKLERQESKLNREIRHDRKTGGGISKKERRQIDRKQDKLSREIYKEKHDQDKTPPAK